MDDQLRQKHKKVIADYQKLVNEWPLKETIEERMAAFKEAQELEPRARIAEECLGSENEPPTEEQRIKGIETFCEWLGVDSSQILKSMAARLRTRPK